jgi:hypothetical protein
LGIEGRFDHRQQGDFHRHAAPFDLFNDMEQVGLAALDVMRSI